MVDTHFKVAKVVRIRYVGRGWNIEELQAATPDQVFARPRIFNDLLSSQPLCFNLFGELVCDPDLATRLFSHLLPGRVMQVTGIEFEFSPGRGQKGFTNDGTAFDVFVRFETPDGGKGFIGIEIKYHEDLKGKPASHKKRYDEIADQMGCFSRGCLSELRAQPLQQIWRDHLLAGALIGSGKDFSEGYYAFVFPADNPFCSNAIGRYKECLQSEKTLKVWTLEQVLDSLAECTKDAWVEKVRDRYLGWDKLEREVSRLR